MKNKLLKLIQLYQEIADLTLPKCYQCRIPLSCCSKEYCEMAIENAREKYNIILPLTDNKDLPLMGKNGCTASPHFRPLCSLHTCNINSLGFEPKDEKFNKKYFLLRAKIEELEYSYEQ